MFAIKFFFSRQFQKYGSRAASTRLAVKHFPSPGDKIYGYTVQSVVPVPEFSLTAIHLQHRTGAQHLHIDRDDSDNVFGWALEVYSHAMNCFHYLIIVVDSHDSLSIKYIKAILIMTFIHSFIADIYIAPLQVGLLRSAPTCSLHCKCKLF